MIPAPYLTSGNWAVPGSAAHPPRQPNEDGRLASKVVGEDARDASRPVPIEQVAGRYFLTIAGWKAAYASQVQWLVDLLGGEKK